VLGLYGSKTRPDKVLADMFLRESMVAAATTIGMATLAKVPVSTTHAIGVRFPALELYGDHTTCDGSWGKRIAWAWILTFPSAGLVGAAAFLLLRVALQPFFGTVNVK
jgi:PiT family inorganic phosphate transporter